MAAMSAATAAAANRNLLISSSFLNMPPTRTNARQASALQTEKKYVTLWNQGIFAL